MVRQPVMLWRTAEFGQERSYKLYPKSAALQGSQLNFAELAFKRIDASWIKIHDYIEWANDLLEGGCDAPSIWELASCRWDVDADLRYPFCLRQTGRPTLQLRA